MSKHRKQFAAAALVVLALGISTPVRAEEQKGNAVTDFFRRLFNYPGKAVKGTADTTAHTLHNTGNKVVSQTGENTAAVLQGDLSRTGNLVVDPVVGAAETTGQTVSETAQIPVQAAQDQTAQAETAAQQ